MFMTLNGLQLTSRERESAKHYRDQADRLSREQHDIQALAYDPDEYPHFIDLPNTGGVAAA